MLALGIPSGGGPSVPPPRRALVTFAALGILAMAGGGFSAGFFHERDKAQPMFGQPLVAMNAVPLGQEALVEWVSAPVEAVPLKTPPAMTLASAEVTTPSYARPAPVAVKTASPAVQADVAAVTPEQAVANPDRPAADTLLY